MVDWAAAGKTFVLLLELWWPNRKLDGFPIPNSHGLIGNIDWGESLAIVACDFSGRNSSGARRRAANAWLAAETCFPKIIPPVIVLKAVDFIT